MIEEVYRTILEQMEDGVYFVDRDRRITYWNAGAERITGYSADDVLLHSCSEGILRHVSEGGYQLCLHGCPLSGVMKDGKAREAQVYLHHKQGHRVPVSVKGSPIRDEGGNIIGSVEVFHRRPSTRFAQVSERERQEDAYVDPLTDLGNRRFGEGHLEPLVAAVGAGAATLGLVFIDVDHFKQVNDTFGHKVGDAVLRMVGQTLANALRNTDWPVRWGGEEFLTILPGVTEAGAGGDRGAVAHARGALVVADGRRTGPRHHLGRGGDAAPGGDRRRRAGPCRQVDVPEQGRRPQRGDHGGRAVGAQRADAAGGYRPAMGDGGSGGRSAVFVTAPRRSTLEV